MTAQISDSVKYRGKYYSIAGKNGNGLFDPMAHGMMPVSTCSANWRGFVCKYSVEGGELLLDELSVGLYDPAPVLFGVSPKLYVSDIELCGAVYKGLKHRMPLTGGLLLADDFIKELYDHMGFHPAWKYRVVHELVFSDGALVKKADRSAQIAKFRRELGGRPWQPGVEAIPTDIERLIETYFSQEYMW